MYNEDQLRFFCEIGLVKHLKDMVRNYHENSRFGGFLKKLEKECIKIQRYYLPPITDADFKAASKPLDKFGYKMKWIGEKKSPNFMFCFDMRLLENSRYFKGKNERLIKIMCDLLKYQEDRGFITEAHYADGDRAYTEWLKIWGETDEDKHNQEESKIILKEATEKVEKHNAEIERQERFEEYATSLYGEKENDT